MPQRSVPLTAEGKARLEDELDTLKNRRKPELTARIQDETESGDVSDNAEYEELGALAREGLEVLRDAPPERRAVLSEIAAFTEFLTTRIPALYAEWQKEREVLIAAGEIPASSTEGPRS